MAKTDKTTNRARPRDPLAFGVVGAFLIAIALVAAYWLARRATRVHPTVAVRYE